MRNQNRYLTAKAFAVLVSNERSYTYTCYGNQNRKAVCLQEDVDDFMAKHSTGLNTLADKLLGNQFECGRCPDLTYPI